MPNHYVQYTESTAGHICVQSEINFLQSQMHRESIYVHAAVVLIVIVQYTESPAGNVCVEYETVFPHNQMKNDIIYVYVALLLSE